MTQENVDIANYYFNKFDTIYVEPIVFGEFTTILVLVYLIRWLILFKIEKGKNPKATKQDLKNVSLYFMGHCLIELLASYIIAYCLIKLTNANPASYIINMIVAPSIGIITAIILDNKFLIPLESASGIGNIFEKKKKKSSDDSGGDKSNGSSSNSNVTINIGGGTSNTKPNMPNMQILRPSTLSERAGQFLSRDIAEDDDFNIKIIDAINEVKEFQNAMSDQLHSSLVDIETLKESEMINKKIELKSMIYRCLNNGFATPEENDKITMYYHAYRSLGGNHEVESLYTNHYLHLGVHEDRRKHSQRHIDATNTYFDPNSDTYKDDRRDSNKRIYVYGELDDVLDINSTEE